MTHALLFVQTLLVNNLCRIALIAIGLFSLLLSSDDLLAAPTTSTNGASTIWNVGSNWTAGAPTSGVSAGIGHSMTVTATDFFGDSATDSEFVFGGSGNLTINTGVTLNHVANSTLLKLNTVSQGLNGSGTFNNAGTISHQQNRIIYSSPNFTFNNSGVYEFTVGSDTHIYMNANGQQFVNAAGGQVRINLPTAADYARIMGGANNSTFVQQTGALAVDWQQGTLIFAPPGGTGSVIDDTAFANLFGTSPNPIPVGSALQLSGGVQLDLTAATDLTRVRLGSSTDAVLQGASIKVAQGIHISNQYGASPTTSTFNTAGGVITNEVGSTIIKDAGVDLQIGGTGSFDNKGLLQLEQNRILFTNATTLNNSGVLEFTEDGSHTYFNAIGSSIVNKAGGRLRVNLDTPTDLARIMGSLTSGGMFIHEAGALAVDWQQGVLEFSPPGGIGETLTDSKFAAMFGTVPAGSGLQIGGAIDINLTSATNMTNVRLGAPVGNDALLGTPTGTTIFAPNGIPVGNLAGGTVAAFNTGTTGSSIRNLVGSTIIKEAGADMQVAGSGTFENDGTITLNSNRILLNSSGVEFNNNNLVHVVENNAHIYVNNVDAVYRNTTDGITRVDLPVGTNVAPFNSAPGGQIDNQGTFEILRGELDFNTSINLLQIGGGGTQLTGGTWRVLADTERSRLDIRASGTGIGDTNQTNFDGTITTIGAGANLVLSSENGGSVEFPQLGPVANLAGEMFVHGDLVLGVDSAMTVTGSLGGDGTLVTAGSISLNGGILDPSALSGGAGTLTVNGNLSLSDTTELTFGLGTPGTVGTGVNDLVEVNGDLVLDGTLSLTDLGGLDIGVYRLFNYTGTLTNNGLVTSSPFFQIDLSTLGQVNLTLIPVPEPSTGLLLLVGLVCVRRKRKNADR